MVVISDKILGESLVWGSNLLLLEHGSELDKENIFYDTVIRRKVLECWLFNPVPIFSLGNERQLCDQISFVQTVLKASHFFHCYDFPDFHKPCAEHSLFSSLQQ